MASKFELVAKFEKLQTFGIQKQPQFGIWGLLTGSNIQFQKGQIRDIEFFYFELVKYAIS